MALIDVAILGFLLSKHPLEGTQEAQLPTSLAARLLYSHKTPIPSDVESKEQTPKPTLREVIDRDFKVFFQSESLEAAPRTLCQRLPTTQVSTNQEATDVLEGIGFEEREPNFMALLNTHVGGNIPAMPVVSRTPTLATTHTSSAEATDKKRKRAQGGKGTRVTKKGRSQNPPINPPLKKLKPGGGSRRGLLLQGLPKILEETNQKSLPSKG